MLAVSARSGAPRGAFEGSTHEQLASNVNATTPDSMSPKLIQKRCVHLRNYTGVLSCIAGAQRFELTASKTRLHMLSAAWHVARYMRMWRQITIIQFDTSVQTLSIGLGLYCLDVVLGALGARFARQLRASNLSARRLSSTADAVSGMLASGAINDCFLATCSGKLVALFISEALRKRFLPPALCIVPGKFRSQPVFFKFSGGLAYREQKHVLLALLRKPPFSLLVQKWRGEYNAALCLGGAQ